MNKKKAIGGFLSIIGLFGLLWILLWFYLSIKNPLI